MSDIHKLTTIILFKTWFLKQRWRFFIWETKMVLRWSKLSYGIWLPACEYKLAFNSIFWHWSYSVLLKVYMMGVLLLVFCRFPDLTDTCHYQPFLCQLGTRQCPMCEKFLCFWSLQQQLLQQIHRGSYMTTNSMRNQKNIFDRHSVFRCIVACHLSWQSRLLVIVPCRSRFGVQGSKFLQDTDHGSPWKFPHMRHMHTYAYLMLLHENEATIQWLCINPQRNEELMIKSLHCSYIVLYLQTHTQTLHAAQQAEKWVTNCCQFAELWSRVQLSFKMLCLPSRYLSFEINLV